VTARAIGPGAPWTGREPGRRHELAGAPTLTLAPGRAGDQPWFWRILALAAAAAAIAEANRRPMRYDDGMAMNNPWPTELRLHKDRKVLTVAFDSGESFDLAAEYLRVRSPSAEVQGHSPSERRTIAGKQTVEILELHPVGNYAVRLIFDDMHSTGIFSWDYLLELGRNREQYWRDYLDELAEKQLSRMPPH
jgi:DUF971 family protein